jgi:hypothetical protein
VFGLVLQEHALSTQVVLGLPNVHPVSLQGHRVDLTLSCLLGEDLPLDGSRSILNSVNDRRVEKVKSSVDLVRHESRWLLNKLLNLSVFLAHDHAVLGRVLDGSSHDCSLLAVILVEGNHFV